MVEFLTSLAGNRAASTMKGYVTAISKRHHWVDGVPLSLHPTVTQWLKGYEKGHGLERVLVPPWDLELVLSALKKPPFEPIGEASDKLLTWKAIFLVAIASARRAGELQALSVKSPYLSFSASGVTLFPRVDFLPKVASRFHVSQPLELPSFHAERDRDVRLLCARRVLKLYVERTRNYRRPGVTQLFIAYGGSKRGSAVSKRRVSAWLVETVAFAYQCLGLPAPEGVKGHQTRSQATSWAEMAGVDPQTLCNAATWSSSCVFAKHYRLDLVAKARSDFGRRVLMAAGSSAADPAPADRSRRGASSSRSFPHS